MSVDERTGHAVLTITDHLDWSDSIGHQAALQTKLNAYLAFVEGGEILKRYPQAKGRPISFDVVFKHAPDAEGKKFLDRARQVVESAGFSLTFSVFADSYDN
jgi:hypothetical protein